MSEAPTRVIIDIVGNDKTDAAIKSASEKLEQLKRQVETPGGGGGKGWWDKLKDEMIKERAMFTGMVFLRYGQRFVSALFERMQNEMIASMNATSKNMLGTMRGGFEQVSKIAKDQLRQIRHEMELIEARRRYDDEIRQAESVEQQMRRRVAVLLHEKNIREDILQLLEQQEKKHEELESKQRREKSQAKLIKDELKKLRILQEHLQGLIEWKRWDKDIQDKLKLIEEFRDKGIFRRISEAAGSFFGIKYDQNIKSEEEEIERLKEFKEKATQWLEAVQDEIDERKRRLEITERTLESLYELEYAEVRFLETQKEYLATQIAKEMLDEKRKSVDRLAEAMRNAARRAKELAGEIAKPIFAGTWDALKGILFPELFGRRVAPLLARAEVPRVPSMKELFEEAKRLLNQQLEELKALNQAITAG